MENNFREVKFDKWCAGCKFCKLADHADPCNDCLDYGYASQSTKPLRFMLADGLPDDWKPDIPELEEHKTIEFPEANVRKE